MNTYIHIARRLYGPVNNRPIFERPDPCNTNSEYEYLQTEEAAYQKWVMSLPSIPWQGDPIPFCKEMVEGKDFETEEEFWGGAAWMPTKYIVNPGTKTRIIARPIAAKVEWLDQTEPSFMDAVNTWMEWIVDNFPKSNAKASLIHLQEEIKEVIEAMDSDVPTPISEEGIPLMEYADCMICLLTAACKSGFTIEQLFTAIKNKMAINYRRKWY